MNVVHFNCKCMNIPVMYVQSHLFLAVHQMWMFHLTYYGTSTLEGNRQIKSQKVHLIGICTWKNFTLPKKSIKSSSYCFT